MTFNLSKRRLEFNEAYREEDVKEFIRLLKECFGVSIIGNTPYTYTSEMINKEIDKLAGEKLI